MKVELANLVSEEDDYSTYSILNSKFRVEKRYEVLDILGTGAYGVVVAAKDDQAVDLASSLVAIKKIEKAFEHPIFTKRTLRELKIWRLVDHENIIKVKTIQMPKSREDFNDIYVITELMETDLSTIIKSPQPLTEEHCQYFLYQILRAMKFLHSAHILHRDLKPRNILVNADCQLKICDFGLARADLDDILKKAPIMTDYVSTRWYRAPELLLSWKQYNQAVDVWSIGCIFAELIGRRPLFPGTDNGDQFKLLVDLLGTPTEEDIENVPHMKAKEYLLNLPKAKPRSFESLFMNASPMALDLLKKLLKFDPSKRISIEGALAHPFLKNYHYPPAEPTMATVSLFDFDFEKYKLSGKELKELIYDEIELYHSKEKKLEYIANKTKYPLGMLHLKNMGKLKKPKKKSNKKVNDEIDLVEAIQEEDVGKGRVGKGEQRANNTKGKEYWSNDLS